MARSSRIPRDDPAIRDFDDQLACYTLNTPPPPAGCGRAYVRFSSLHAWFLKPPTGDDARRTSTQARRLLEYAYRDWPEYGHSNFMPTSKLFDTPGSATGCIKIFSILLKMGWGCLVHLFRSQQKCDHNLPIDIHNLNRIFQTIFKKLSSRQIYFDPGALADEFDELQSQFCPAKFELEEESSFDQKQIIPIVKKSILSNKGGTAVLWQIEVLQEFVTDRLAAAVPQSQYDPQDGLGPRFNFALKTFKEGYKQAYDRELDAFRSVPHQGMIRYLSAYTQEVIQQAEDHHLVTHLDSPTQETHNILLEFGECDLGTVFEEEPLPLALQADIDGFWSNLFPVAKTLGQIHNTTQDTDGMRREFWGWHADIKPSNILEIDGKFKLADPGFAKFKEKDARDNTRPVARLDGGTSTYSAPEQIPRRGLDLPDFHQTIDVWALGCVFSEAATWVVLGEQGVRKYTQLREQGNARALKTIARLGKTHSTPKLQEGDYFHDGRAVLSEVTGWHHYLRTVTRGTDHVTCYVLDVIEKGMFIGDPLERWQASEVYEQLLKISIGLDDSMSTVPKEIVDFLSLNAEVASSEQAGRTSSQNIDVSYRRRDRRSRYLSAPVRKTTARSNIESSHISNVYDSDPVPPETPKSIVDGPLYHSPTHSATFAPDDIYGKSETYIGKQPSEIQPSRPLMQAPFRGRVEDIFQAREAIDERTTMDKLRAFSRGKKPVDDDLARHYQNRDIKFLVDNSWSMSKHWAHVKFVLKTLVMKAKGLDPDGVDLYFTSSRVTAERKTDVKSLMDAMSNPNALPPKSNNGLTTNMASRLKDLFNEYIRITKLRIHHGQKVTDLTIIVLTNGMWDEGLVGDRIVEFAAELKDLIKKDIVDRPVSVQFIQFGRDPTATERLETLDDKLKYRNIPDLVDAEPADGNVYKMLLGSFVQEFDDQKTELDEDDTATMLQPSSSTHTHFNKRQSTTNTIYSQPTTQSTPYPTPPRSQGSVAERTLSREMSGQKHRFPGSPPHYHERRNPSSSQHGSQHRVSSNFDSLHHEYQV